MTEVQINLLNGLKSRNILNLGIVWLILFKLLKTPITNLIESYADGAISQKTRAETNYMKSQFERQKPLNRAELSRTVKLSTVFSGSSSLALLRKQLISSIER